MEGCGTATTVDDMTMKQTLRDLWDMLTSTVGRVSV